jgi:7-cyano-7-deazaguanine synthase
MKQLNQQRSLVLFSGGQDSTITLAWALDRFDYVETVAFDYGQRHAVELKARRDVRNDIAGTFPDWAKRLGEDTTIDLAGFGAINDTALTRDVAIVTGDDGLPTTFVPGRNLVFLTMAAARAYMRDLGVLVAGMCEADYSGYPDCRSPALAAQTEALRLGLDANLTLETPLMTISKAASWKLAHSLGGAPLVEIVRTRSHSCYLGVRDTLHDWGYGCGACPACVLRENGWRDYAADTKTGVQ